MPVYVCVGLIPDGVIDFCFVLLLDNFLAIDFLIYFFPVENETIVCGDGVLIHSVGKKILG